MGTPVDSTVLGGSGDTAFLEEVCHWEGFENKKPCLLLVALPASSLQFKV